VCEADKRDVRERLRIRAGHRERPGELPLLVENVRDPRVEIGERAESVERDVTEKTGPIRLAN